MPFAVPPMNGANVGCTDAATFAMMHPLKAAKYGAIYLLVKGLTRRS